MKLTFTKQLWLFLLLCALSFFSFAQNEINTEIIARMNNVFAPLEKNRVPTGLLLDYAMEFADLKSYNGLLRDSNKVNAGVLNDIYTTVAMSAIHTNAGGFYSPAYQDSFWQTQRQPGIIILSGLYYNYSRFKDNAASGGFVTVSNEQFFDRYVSGIWQNPYQEFNTMAISPSIINYNLTYCSAVLPSNLFLTNRSSEISTIQFDAANG